MKQICVIGNSHVGPLKQMHSEKRLLRYHCDLTFFVCHLSHMAALDLQGRKLVAGSEELARFYRASSGQPEIDLDRFDQFVIVGHGFAIHSLVHQARRYRCDSLSGPRGSRYLLSDACFIAFAAQQLAQRNEAMRVARMIRSVTAKPITLVAEPNPGLGIPRAEAPWWLAPHYQAVEDGEDVALARLFRTACDAISANLSIRIIPPIAELAANGLFNRREACLLSDDSPEETRKDPINAMMHGNRLSGEFLLGQLFEAASRGPDTPASASRSGNEKLPAARTTAGKPSSGLRAADA